MLTKSEKKYKMFREAKTEEDILLVKEIWEQACKQMNYESEDYHIDVHGGGVYYLILDEKGNPIGTAEAGPFVPGGFSTLEEYYEFSKDKRFVLHAERIMEIDKLCLLKGHQRRGYFKHFLYLFLYHTHKYNMKYFIGSMESKFFRGLNIFYHFHPERLTEDDLEYDGFSLVPVYIDAQDIWNKREEFDWYDEETLNMHF